MCVQSDSKLPTGDLMAKVSSAAPQTMYLLMAEYGARTLIPLDEIANTVLGMSINTARRRARSYELPFATVRLGESQKAPYHVHLHDLAKFIEARCNEARIEWRKVQAA